MTSWRDIAASELLKYVEQRQSLLLAIQHSFNKLENAINYYAHPAKDIDSGLITF